VTDVGALLSFFSVRFLFSFFDPTLCASPVCCIQTVKFQGVTFALAEDNGQETSAGEKIAADLFRSGGIHCSGFSSFCFGRVSKHLNKRFVSQKCTGFGETMGQFVFGKTSLARYSAT